MQNERYRIRVSYKKESPLTFISHKSLIDVLMRAIRRADIPLRFTEGYSPRPKVIFSPPLPLGVTGSCELIDIEATRYIETDDFLHKLNLSLPSGLYFTKATNLLNGAPGLNKMISRATYTLLPYDVRECQNGETGSWSQAATMIDSEKIVITKKAKKGKPPKEVDIRPYIHKLTENTDGLVTAEIDSGDKTVSPLILGKLLWPEFEDNVLEQVKITRKGFISPDQIKLY